MKRLCGIEPRDLKPELPYEPSFHRALLRLQTYGFRTSIPITNITARSIMLYMLVVAVLYRLYCDDASGGTTAASFTRVAQADGLTGLTNRNTFHHASPP
jgi:hypothetical protein